MDKDNIEIPLGFGMALMQHAGAMKYFSSLPEEEQKQIINHTHTIDSKEEMQAYVESLVENKSRT